jgi:hypothetical protein
MDSFKSLFYKMLPDKQDLIGAILESVGFERVLILGCACLFASTAALLLISLGIGKSKFSKALRLRAAGALESIN